MKFESKHDIGQLVEFTPKNLQNEKNFSDENTSITEFKVGTIKQVRFTDPKTPTYDIGVMNTKDIESDVPEKNIVKAFRATT